MGTEKPSEYVTLRSALGAADWADVVDGVGTAEAWLRDATPGDRRIDEVVSSLVMLASHPKWEVRRAVANAAAQVLHPALEPGLVKLATDDNSRVRQAAENASLRRRDWQNASTLGKQHEDRINLILDDIEVRFGSRGRNAVKRASEQIANTFSRELYHEVIKLLSPLAVSADRLRTQLADSNTARPELAEEAERIGHRVTYLRSVLDGMRSYTDIPVLTFEREDIKEIIEDAAALVREGGSIRAIPPIHVKVDIAVSAEVSRARLGQAVINILQNAVESYAGVASMKPILVCAVSEEGRVAITIEDGGCGMGEEALADATVLFATSKPNGTGFGLPLAIKIVESEHGGRLSIESLKGRGTVVRIVIPQQRQRGFL
jgi:nitrogen fixation/metabolism regulation signal transduction histidine kinase